MIERVVFDHSQGHGHSHGTAMHDESANILNKDH
jgi:hypothetical protein